jgi:hypothetical protein
MKDQEKFAEAIYLFNKKYPNISSGDLQSFSMGWQGALENRNTVNLKIAVAKLREKMELFDIFQQDDEVGLALSNLEKEINKK